MTSRGISYLNVLVNLIKGNFQHTDHSHHSEKKEHTIYRKNNKHGVFSKQFGIQLYSYFHVMLVPRMN